MFTVLGMRMEVLARLAMASALLSLAYSKPQGADAALRSEGSKALLATSAGQWGTTSALATARDRHTATLLPSGKVLVTGGFSQDTYRESAEVYDPSTEQWRPTTSLAKARLGHTATLLPSGKVLITGGFGPDGLLNYVELYDPLTERWTRTGDLHEGRAMHRATLLPNGKVLVTGGFGPNGISLSSAEVYDPNTGTWTPTKSSMNQGRAWHTATLLPDSKVLVAGGVPTLISPPLISAEVYDPDTEKWSITKTPLVEARDRHTAALLPSGKVLVIGGINSIGNNTFALASTEVYDPLTDAWSPTKSSLTTARYNHTTTLLPSGLIVVTGGRDPNGFFVSAEVYDPVTEQWSPTSSLANARDQHTATLLPSGQILVTGGSGSDAPLYLASAEVYTPRRWSSTRARPVASDSHSATLLSSGKVLCTGGFDSNGALSDAAVYDPDTGTWAPTKNTLPQGRGTHTATLLLSGKVLVAGGGSSLNTPPFASMEVYDPLTDEWTPAKNSLAKARNRHTATRLLSGQVLFVGGVGSDGVLDSAEIYDPAPEAQSLMKKALATARYWHTATLLRSGKVLITGGLDSHGTPLASAEIYDPATGKWTLSKNTMAEARANHAAILLPSGMVLVTGGFGDKNIPLASAELYDPDANWWSTTGALINGRGSHTVALLPSGKVLAAGGYAEGGASASGEVYDPATERWSNLIDSSLVTARAVHTATQLPSGKVLVTGGVGAVGNYLDSAEVYDESEPPGSPVVEAISPKKPEASFVAQGTGFIGAHNGPGRVRIQMSPEGEFKDLPASDISNTSMQITLSGVTEGYHLLFMLVDGVARGQFLRVDGTPPSAPIVSKPGAFVKTQTPTIGGTAEAGSTVTVMLDGAEVGNTLADAEGNWDFIPTTLLEEGAHLAVAIATDAAGNIGPASEASDFTVDITPPRAPVMTAPSAFINTSKPIISGTAEPGGAVTVSVDGQVTGTTTADAAGGWNFSLTTTLNDGAHMATASATDVAGNVSLFSEPQSFTVDTVPPQVPVVSEPGAPVNTREPTISGTAEPGCMVTVLVDGSTVGSTQADASGNWSLAMATALTEGLRLATASTTDAAGNPSPPSEAHAFTVDVTPPDVPRVTTPTDGSITNEQPTYGGTAEAGSTVTLFVNERMVGTTTADASGSWSFPQPALTDDSYRITVHATDTAGNTSSVSAPSTFTLDTLAPAAPHVTAPGALVNTRTPTISGSAELGSSVNIQLDGTPTEPIQVDTDGSWSFRAGIALEIGQHIVSVTATDKAGNTSLHPSEYSFTVQSSHYGWGCTSAPALPVTWALVALGWALRRRWLRSP